MAAVPITCISKISITVPIDGQPSQSPVLARTRTTSMQLIFTSQCAIPIPDCAIFSLYLTMVQIYLTMAKSCLSNCYWTCNCSNHRHLHWMAIQLAKTLSFLPEGFFLQDQYLWQVVCCWKMLKRQSITSLLHIPRRDQNETTDMWLQEEPCTL